MTDLFAAIQSDFREERAAILEFDAGIPRNEAERQADTMSEEYRHQCEVRSVAKLYREQGADEVTAFLNECRKHRPAEAVERLRVDAWGEYRKGNA